MQLVLLLPLFSCVQTCLDNNSFSLSCYRTIIHACGKKWASSAKKKKTVNLAGLNQEEDLVKEDPSITINISRLPSGNSLQDTLGLHCPLNCPIPPSPLGCFCLWHVQALSQQPWALTAPAAPGGFVTWAVQLEAASWLGKKFLQRPWMTFQLLDSHPLLEGLSLQR